jgi:hypothetical protein
MVRSLLAVALGYVVMLVAYRGCDLIITALKPEFAPQPGEPPDAAYFVFLLGTGFFFMIVGGYVAALLAGRSEMKHALSLGALSIAMGILEAILFEGEQPLWYTVALMFLSIPSALVGGYFRLRQVEDGESRAAATD